MCLNGLSSALPASCQCLALCKHSVPPCLFFTSEIVLLSSEAFLLLADLLAFLDQLFAQRHKLCGLYGVMLALSQSLMNLLFELVRGLLLGQQLQACLFECLLFTPRGLQPVVAFGVEPVGLTLDVFEFQFEALLLLGQGRFTLQQCFLALGQLAGRLASGFQLGSPLFNLGHLLLESSGSSAQFGLLFAEPQTRRTLLIVLFGQAAR